MSSSALRRRKPVTTAYTISLATPDAMAQAAAKAADRALLKVKLGGARRPRAHRRGAARGAARRADRRRQRGLDRRTISPRNLAACAQAGVTLVEQPLPAGRDDALAHIARPLPICADESVHASASLSALVGKYDAVNIKLDKTGGLTEALAMAGEADRLGFTLMVGCMVATSLAMAPALLVAQRARVVDLDGRCCSRATGRTACATTAAAFTRRRRRCGDETWRRRSDGGAVRPYRTAHRRLTTFRLSSVRPARLFTFSPHLIFKLCARAAPPLPGRRREHGEGKHENRCSGGRRRGGAGGFNCACDGQNQGGSRGSNRPLPRKPGGAARHPASGSSSTAPACRRAPCCSA